MEGSNFFRRAPAVGPGPEPRDGVAPDPVTTGNSPPNGKRLSFTSVMAVHLTPSFEYEHIINCVLAMGPWAGDSVHMHGFGDREMQSYEECSYIFSDKSLS
jgi:hypothetical protein